MRVNTLLAACLLLAGLNGVSAAGAGAGTSCTSIATGNALATGDVCVCPTGAGSGLAGTPTSNSIAAGGAVTTGNGGLALCTDVLPGYYLTAANTGPAACTGSGKYCLGLLNAYAGTAGAITCTGGATAGTACTGSSTSNPNTVTGGAFAYATSTSGPIANGVAAANGAKGGLSVCPTGFGNTASVTSVDETSCVDISPGYYQVGAIGAAADLTVATATAVAVCPSGSYCPGATGVLLVSGTSRINVASTWDGVSSGTFVTTAGTSIAAAAANTAPNKVACPTGTTNALTGGSNVGLAATDATVCDDLAPGYTILANILASGSTAVTIAGSGLLTGITPCAAGSYCLGKNNIINILTMPTSTTFTYAAITALAAGTTTGAPQACPAGTTNALTLGAATTSATAVDYSACTDIKPAWTIGSTPLAAVTPAATAGGATLAAFTTAVTTSVVACPLGSFCVGQAGAFVFTVGTTPNQYTYPGVTTSSSAKTCPTGTTGTVASATSAVLACTDLAPGYAILANIAAQSSAGAVTALTTGITPCAIGFYCPGKTTLITITAGTTGSTFTWTAITAPAAGTTTGAPQACTAGFGLSTASSSAVSAATGCNAVAPGYSIPATTAATASITPAQCAAGSYCQGLSTATGITFTANGISSAGATSAAGTTACPVTGATSAAGATAASGCSVVLKGYYIDPSSLTVPTTCAVGEYCPGTGGQYLDTTVTPPALATATTLAVGTAGGEFNCPTGSVTPGNGGIVNNALADCNLLPGYFIPATATAGTAASFVPVSCPAGYQCPGGSAIGTPGGSSPCPVNSTIPACTVAAVSAPGVTVAAGTAPAVTVAAGTAPAVTVAAGAAPIVNVTVAAAPIISSAPRAAAHAAVLALTAMAALVAF